MKTTVSIFMICLLTIANCKSQQAFKFTDDQSVLEFYKQYSMYTDPGAYSYLYKNLPDSLPELCRLIKLQIIHPFAELSNYGEQIPRERSNEYTKYPTVKSILEGLLSYDSSGLVNDRKPEDRLVLICQQNAILLASILKYRGIPARVRYGFAPYLMPGFHANHAICEVWNEKESRWMLVDPTTNMIDFNREEFDFSNDVWLKMQKKEIDPKIYGMPGQDEYNGSPFMTTVICFDLASVLGNEYPVGQHSPILDYVLKNNQITREQMDILNKISELMRSDHISKLQKIYHNTPEIQFTQQHDPVILIPENDTKDKDSSINKPIIEFVAIPGGTFIMGSPVAEHGRKDDEVQHKVTVSSFKMSKYAITVEQYDLFCEATGRKKPFLFGPYGGVKMPVSQVSWYDAQAFAEWMGCRLPTEAEFEYSARANTKTPFYTGDCLTSEQANFNGEEPYFNCEKGENRKKPLPVGSFAPNEFGLYDMNGNMVEWCNDWFGAYNMDEKINPKGPETGEIKVIRGGGFWTPGWRCRSACRAGDPPVNRGSGLSFRIVKDE